MLVAAHREAGISHERYNEDQEYERHAKRVSVIGSFNDWDGDRLCPEAREFLGASGVAYLAKPFYTAVITTECLRHLDQWLSKPGGERG